MKSLVQGVHHITLCPGGAQQDIDFFTQVLGQRLIKQTVLMDGTIPIYHFYYGNADADVGSIATCFPYSRKPGRAGSGQLSCTSYTVPDGATAFWKDHFDRHQWATPRYASMTALLFLISSGTPSAIFRP